MTAKTPLLFLLGSLVLLGCEKEPSESEGTWEHEKTTLKNLTCESSRPGHPDCILGWYDSDKVASILELDPESKVKTRVICNGEEKSGPSNDLSFILSEISKRPGICTVELREWRNTHGYTGEPTFQRLRVTFEENGTWTLERSTFTPSKSWMD